MMGPMGMMLVAKAMALGAFIVTTLLLAVSFFVIVTVRKVENQGLKVFGYVVAILLWICSAVVFSGVVSATSMKCRMDSSMMRGGMRGMKADRMQKHMPMPQQGQEHGQMPMPQEKPAGEKPAQ